MTPFERLLDEAKKAKSKSKMKPDTMTATGVTKFKEFPGTDAFQHSDRSKRGRRNQSPGTWFQGKNRRYPLWQQRASVAGTLRQAYERDPKLAKKIAAKVREMKNLKMCPTILPECPPKRDHGKGGKPEHKTDCKGKHCDLPSDHGKQSPWPFAAKKGPTWDKDWKALGGKKGSGKSDKQKAKEGVRAKQKAAFKASMARKGKKQEDVTLERRPLLSLGE